MPLSEPLEIRKYRGPFQVISLTFDFFRQNAKPLSKSIVMLVGPVVLVLLACAVLVLKSFYSSVLTDAAQLGRIGWGSVGAGLVGVIGFTIMCAVVHQFVILYMERGPDGFDVADVRRAAFSDVPGLLGTMLAIAFLGFLTILPATALRWLALLVIPIWIYLSVPLALLPSIRSRERLGPIDGLRRSIELIRDNWWRTFALIFLMGIIVSMVSSFVYIPFSLIVGLSSFHRTTADYSDAVGTLAIGMAIFYAVAYFLYSLVVLAINLQYYSLAERLDRTAIMDRIDSIGRRDDDGEQRSTIEHQGSTEYRSVLDDDQRRRDGGLI